MSHSSSSEGEDKKIWWACMVYMQMVSVAEQKLMKLQYVAYDETHEPVQSRPAHHVINSNVHLPHLNEPVMMNEHTVI